SSEDLPEGFEVDEDVQVVRGAGEDVVERARGVLDVEGAKLGEELTDGRLVEDGVVEASTEQRDERVVGSLVAGAGARHRHEASDAPSLDEMAEPIGSRSVDGRRLGFRLRRLGAPVLTDLEGCDSLDEASVTADLELAQILRVEGDLDATSREI